MDSRYRRRPSPHRRRRSPSSSSSSSRSSFLSAISEKEQKSYVRLSNLSKNVSLSVLNDICGCFGSVKNVELVTFPRTKKLKGVAYVEYETVEEAKEALGCLEEQEEGKTWIDGRPIEAQLLTEHLEEDKPYQAPARKARRDDRRSDRRSSRDRHRRREYRRRDDHYRRRRRSYSSSSSSSVSSRSSSSSGRSSSSSSLPSRSSKSN